MYLIDSNILIYYLGANDKAVHFIQTHQGQLAISTLTVMEVLSYPFEEKELLSVEQFLRQYFVWFNVSHDIIFETARIRRLKKMKGVDALIAGTALVHGLKLVTRNLKDFHHLPLELSNPIDEI